jgi:hypothetical protein
MNAVELANELNIRPELLYRWRTEFASYQGKSFPGNGKPKLTEEESEVAQLKKELAEMRMERACCNHLINPIKTDKIEKLMTNSRTTEVDAVSLRTIGAYKNTSLSSDAHLASIFTALKTESVRLTAAIKRSKAESELEVKCSRRGGKGVR